ncbi:hypothetical protein M0804_008968 [Polistes exclamans]|nr:hypothetical protein M0804_008968 [Polistes exclamans]
MFLLLLQHKITTFRQITKKKQKLSAVDFRKAVKRYNIFGNNWTDLNRQKSLTILLAQNDLRSTLFTWFNNS